MNTINAVFGGGSRYCTTRSVFQIDKGDVLRFVGLDLPEYYEVHFANNKNALATRVLASGDSVVIPWEFMRHGQKEVYAWIYLTPDAQTGYTPYQVTIPLATRSDISDAQPTPAQKDIVDEAIAALNVGVERTENAADKAEEATEHYPCIVNSYWQVWDAETQQWRDTGVKAVGEDGAPGQPGRDGEDGYSPTVTVTDIPGGHRVKITDETGPHSFDVMDGQGGGSSAVQSVNGKTGVVTLDAEDVGAMPDSTTLDDIPDGTTYKRPTGAQLQQISTNTEAITTKQPKITASGLLKGDGQGNVTAATPGTDYATPQQVDAKYTKPASGIPKSDMAQDVQTSLGKADTAIQPADYAPEAKTAAMTQPVGKDASGKLWTEPGSGGTDVRDMLLGSTIPGTTQTVTFDTNGQPQSIVHSDGNVTVRTDVFTWTASSVTEIRTLATGEQITITTNLVTLVTVISDIEEAV